MSLRDRRCGFEIVDKAITFSLRVYLASNWLSPQDYLMKSAIHSSALETYSTGLTHGELNFPNVVL